jgi:hypothetical protein
MRGIWSTVQSKLSVERFLPIQVCGTLDSPACVLLVVSGTDMRSILTFDACLREADFAATYRGGMGGALK